LRATAQAWGIIPAVGSGHDFARTVWQKMSNHALVYGVPVYDFEPIVFNRYEPENQTKYSAAF
jgi:hypothetical protein